MQVLRFLKSSLKIHHVASLCIPRGHQQTLDPQQSPVPNELTAELKEEAGCLSHKGVARQMASPVVPQGESAAKGENSPIHLCPSHLPTLLHATPHPTSSFFKSIFVRLLAQVPFFLITTTFLQLKHSLLDVLHAGGCSSQEEKGW